MSFQTRSGPQAVSEARRAAERALELQPGYGDTYGNWCLLHSETRRAECEDRLRAGRRKDPDAPFLNTFLSHVLRDVGRFDELMDLAKLAHTHDVYFPTKIAWMLKTHETAGEVDEARDLYRQGARWWPDFKPMYFRNRLYGLVAIGDFQGMVRLEREVATTKVLPDYQESRPLAAAVKSKSIACCTTGLPQALTIYYLECPLHDSIGELSATKMGHTRSRTSSMCDGSAERRRRPSKSGSKEPESPGPGIHYVPCSRGHAPRSPFCTTCRPHWPAGLLAQRAATGLLSRAPGAHLQAIA